MASGDRLSVPLGMTPCGSREPNGTRTVLIRAGTSSPNSCQQSRAISRVVGDFVWAAPAAANAAASETAVRTIRIFFMSVASSLPPSYAIRGRLGISRDAMHLIFSARGL
jgi:hypothetical protein